MSYMDFSSWPRDQEQAFVVYEQHATESSRKAFTLGTIVGLAFLVVMVGIYAGVEPDKKDLSQGMNMNNLTKKSKKADAPAPAPTPAPAAAPTPAPEPPKAETPPAPEGGAAPAAPAPAAEKK